MGCQNAKFKPASRKSLESPKPVRVTKLTVKNHPKSTKEQDNFISDIIKLHPVQNNSAIHDDSTKTEKIDKNKSKIRHGHLRPSYEDVETLSFYKIYA